MPKRRFRPWKENRIRSCGSSFARAKKKKSKWTNVQYASDNYCRTRARSRWIYRSQRRDRWYRPWYLCTRLRVSKIGWKKTYDDLKKKYNDVNHFWTSKVFSAFRSVVSNTLLCASNTRVGIVYRKSSLHALFVMQYTSSSETFADRCLNRKVPGMTSALHCLVRTPRPATSIINNINTCVSTRP